MTHATCRLTARTGISSEILRSVIEYGLHLPLPLPYQGSGALQTPPPAPLSRRTRLVSTSAVVYRARHIQYHRCKNVFTFFYFGHVFTFLTFFSNVTFFLFLKNVGKVQSGKQINKKHFQNNSNEIDL